MKLDSHLPKLAGLLTPLVAGAALLSAVSAAQAAAKPGVQITTLADRLRVEINGQLFTEYCYRDTPRPYCYPLIGPVVWP